MATWPVPFGRDALAIEAAVVEWWRASGARACTRDEVPKGDGWTEAVHITTAADEPRTIAYIEELVAEVARWESAARDVAAALRIAAARYTESEAHGAAELR